MEAEARSGGAWRPRSRNLNIILSAWGVSEGLKQVTVKRV